MTFEIMIYENWFDNPFCDNGTNKNDFIDSLLYILYTFKNY